MVMNRSVCGCSLRTGSSLIGVLFMFGSSCILIVCTVNTEDITEHLSRKASNMDAGTKYITIVHNLIIAASVLCAVQIVVNALLLLGCCLEEACYLYPWMWMYSVMALVSIIICAVVPAIYFSQEFSVEGIFAFIASVGNIGITFYSLGVVYSYCRNLKRIYPCIQ